MTPRLLWLASAANPDAASREAHRLVLARAGGPAPPADPGLAEEMELLDRARACACRAPAARPCRYGSCTRLGREVAPADCLACLRAGDDAGAAPPADQPSAGAGR